jgi:N-acetylmuramoyl-L-alanine amidase
VNAGHGALQPGKRSPVIPELGNRFYEYEWNREIVKGIIAELAYLGIEYFEVVPEINVDDFLVERVSRANNHPSLLPKIYLSVHANAGPAPDLDTWSDASGTETWYYHGSRLGRNLAAVFQRQLVKATGFRNRHLRSKAKGQFYELRKTQMVSVLTESGFYNNRTEVMKLINPEMKRRIIMAHVSAIIEIEKTGL